MRPTRDAQQQCRRESTLAIAQIAPKSLVGRCAYGVHRSTQAEIPRPLDDFDRVGMCRPKITKRSAAAPVAGRVELPGVARFKRLAQRGEGPQAVARFDSQYVAVDRKPCTAARRTPRSSIAQADDLQFQSAAVDGR